MRKELQMNCKTFICDLEFASRGSEREMPDYQFNQWMKEQNDISILKICQNIAIEENGPIRKIILSVFFKEVNSND